MKLKYLFSTLIFPFIMNAQNVMTPEMLWTLNKISVSAVAPNQSSLIYSVGKVDLKTEKTNSKKYFLNTKSGVALDFDLGKKGIIQWDENGFYAQEEGKIFLSKDAGKSWNLFYEIGEVDEIKISPDGKKIAFSKAPTLTFKAAALDSAILAQAKSLDEGLKFEITINTVIATNLSKEAALIHELVHAFMLNDLNKVLMDDQKLIIWQPDGTASIANNAQKICDDNDFNSADPKEHFAAVICKHLQFFQASGTQWMHDLFNLSYFDTQTYSDALKNYLKDKHDWDGESQEWKNVMENIFGANWKGTVSKYVVMDALRETSYFEYWWGNNTINSFDNIIKDNIEKGKLAGSNEEYLIEFNL